MIFRQWQAVLDGTKTQTRRLVRANELASGNRLPVPSIHAVWVDTKGIYDPKYEQHDFIFRSAWVILEELYRLKWVTARGFHTDKTYAVQPGRGQPAIMYKIDPSGGIIAWDWSRADSRLSIAETKQQLITSGWHEGRIRITEIRREQVQDISKEDIMAEGICLKSNRSGDSGWSNGLDGLLHVRPEWAFRALWNSIHKPGTRWRDNPEVWPLTIEVVRPAVRGRID